MILDSFITFKWKPDSGYRSEFTSTHVNRLFEQLQRNYDRPVRFICITDDSEGLDSHIEAVPLWNTFSNLRNPTWRHGPNCYRRLPTFGVEFESIAGKRFAALDIDVVITSNVTDLFDRDEDFVIWGTTNKRIPYCASMYMMTAGAKREVLDRFNPEVSPREADAAGFRGSDQGWINYCLGADIPVWNKSHGVYSYRDHIMFEHKGRLPSNAKVIIFHGKPDPWEPAVKARSRWIRSYHP